MKSFEIIIFVTLTWQEKSISNLLTEDKVCGYTIEKKKLCDERDVYSYIYWLKSAHGAVWNLNLNPVNYLLYVSLYVCSHM